MPEPIDISFFNFHPPVGARLFTSPGAELKRWDSVVLVFDVRIGDGILRNYPFADRWFEVHCTFDPDGRLRPEAGPVDWVFNCDMCTERGRRAHRHHRNGGGPRPFLEDILPFDSVFDTPPQEPPRYLPLVDVPLFRFDERRARWHDLGPQQWPDRAGP